MPPFAPSLQTRVERDVQLAQAAAANSAGYGGATTPGETNTCLFAKDHETVIIALMALVIVQAMVLCGIAFIYFHRRKKLREPVESESPNPEEHQPRELKRASTRNHNSSQRKHSDCSLRSRSLSESSLATARDRCVLFVNDGRRPSLAPSETAVRPSSTPPSAFALSLVHDTKVLAPSPRSVRLHQSLGGPPVPLKDCNLSSSCPMDFLSPLTETAKEHNYASLHRHPPYHQDSIDQDLPLEDADGYLKPVDDDCACAPNSPENEPDLDTGISPLKRPRPAPYTHVYDQPPKTPDGELDQCFRRSNLRYTVPNGRRMDILRALRARAGSNSFQVGSRKAGNYAEVHRPTGVSRSRSHREQYTRPLQTGTHDQDKSLRSQPRPRPCPPNAPPFPMQRPPKAIRRSQSERCGRYDVDPRPGPQRLAITRRLP